MEPRLEISCKKMYTKVFSVLATISHKFDKDVSNNMLRYLEMGISYDFNVNGFDNY